MTSILRWLLSAVLVCAATCRAEPPAAPPSPNDKAPVGGWKLDDLAKSLHNLRGRSYERGKQLFERNHCVVCHPPNDVGKEFGPDLTKLDPRFQPLDILRDIIEPSRRIADSRYELWMFETEWGREVSGLIAQETFQTVKIMEQPPAKAPPVVLKRAEITRRQMSLMSIMPQRMLDGLTRDEIADLVAYVAARGDPQAPEVQPISTEE